MKKKIIVNMRPAACGGQQLSSRSREKNQSTADAAQLAARKFIISALIFILAGAGSVLFAAADGLDAASLSVAVSNPIFSPYAKQDGGIVFTPKVENAGKIKIWFLSIFNENGAKVREFIGKNSLPDTVVWDGRNEKGEPVNDGAYSYKFFAQLKKNKRALIIEKSGLVIDSILPFVSIKSSDDIYFINENDGLLSKNINLYLSAGDENAIDFSKSFVRVINYNDREVKTFGFNSKIPEFIVWDGKDDIYNIRLPQGNYKIVFSVSDKAGNSSQIGTEISVVDMPKTPAEPKEELEVKQEERGLVINLSSKVLFDASKSDLKPEAEKSLSEVAAILLVYPRNKVLIEGHTDSSGKESKNETLSLERAQAVRDFFISKGIDNERMSVYGLGSSKPVASNDSESGRQQNRRVEIVILKTEESPQAPQSAGEEADVKKEEAELFSDGSIE
ncbi:MAG: OmpA family protein [Endomicrobium sp.]|jgi:outer membrane protein OmpA-like peptidoglycan-associated protein|nr:OmpA family protein [Endomicrobium sp.]